MNIKSEHIKPYIFIVLFLLVPILFFQVVKKVLNQNKYADTHIVGQNTHVVEPENIEPDTTFNYGIIIHGATLEALNLSSEFEIAYKTKLYEALQTGISKLEHGDSAIYIVESVLKILEDSPLFNAGKGASVNANGQIELDAVIMDGNNKQSGTALGMHKVKNPISLARSVLQSHASSVLSGQQADQFAQQHALESVTSAYFKNGNRLITNSNDSSVLQIKYATIGCVVLDKFGNLSSGTSTGGFIDKNNNRMGGSAIIGTTTFADNATCAIASLGSNDFFTKNQVANDMVARIKYNKQTMNQAANAVLSEFNEAHIKGGIIGIDTKGKMTIVFNTPGFMRGFYSANREPKVLLYKK